MTQLHACVFTPGWPSGGKVQFGSLDRNQTAALSWHVGLLPTQNFIIRKGFFFLIVCLAAYTDLHMHETMSRSTSISLGCLFVWLSCHQILWTSPCNRKGRWHIGPDKRGTSHLQPRKLQTSYFVFVKGKWVANVLWTKMQHACMLCHFLHLVQLATGSVGNKNNIFKRLSCWLTCLVRTRAFTSNRADYPRKHTPVWLKQKTTTLEDDVRGSTAAAEESSDSNPAVEASLPRSCKQRFLVRGKTECGVVLPFLILSHFLAVKQKKNKKN